MLLIGIIGSFHTYDANVNKMTSIFTSLLKFLII